MAGLGRRDFRSVLAVVAGDQLSALMPTIGRVATMSGVEVFGRLAAIAPEVPVVVMSGYSSQEMAAQFPDRRPGGYLQKPFGRDQLRVAMQALLDPTELV